ncbi:MAG: hypothetical protein ABH849_02860 [Nanoarchaeota archaeon]
MVRIDRKDLTDYLSIARQGRNSYSDEELRLLARIAPIEAVAYCSYPSSSPGNRISATQIEGLIKTLSEEGVEIDESIRKRLLSKKEMKDHEIKASECFGNEQFEEALEHYSLAGEFINIESCLEAAKKLSRHGEASVYAEQLAERYVHNFNVFEELHGEAKKEAIKAGDYDRAVSLHMGLANRIITSYSSFESLVDGDLKPLIDLAAKRTNEGTSIDEYVVNAIQKECRAIKKGCHNEPPEEVIAQIGDLAEYAKENGLMSLAEKLNDERTVYRGQLGS